METMISFGIIPEIPDAKNIKTNENKTLTFFKVAN